MDKELGKKILLIEDDLFLSNMYKTKLELEGFNVIVARDGESGYRQAEETKPDLILLDIILPKKDGFEVLRELKENAAVKEIPVILLSNLGQRSDIDRGLNLGAADYLVKAHFMPSEVTAKIRQILGIA